MKLSIEDLYKQARKAHDGVAPPFRVVAEPPPQRSKVWVVVPAAATACALLFFLSFGLEDESVTAAEIETPNTIAFVDDTWDAPTDFLLVDPIEDFDSSSTFSDFGNLEALKEL